ncbi:hypothetical protein ABZP36_028065 [Zizania latifolia]
MASRSKLSGIQRQVLALYRGFLRTARLKSPEERHRIESVVSAEFRDNARNVDRKNFVYIEYLLRRGKKQLEQLKDPDITGLSTLEMNKFGHMKRQYCFCLMVTLAHHRRLAAAVTLFSCVIRTTHALNSLLAALCSSSAFIHIAPKVLLLAAPFASPDTTTFRILSSALCRARRPSAAADLLRCMPSLLLDPDPVHIRAVLSSLCQCGPARDAATFLDEMRQWGVSPTRSDHHAVFGALLREGMVVEAYEVVKNKMDSDGVAPTLSDFGAILQAFSESREFESVEVVFDEMLLRGLVPDVGVYNMYIGALCRKGDMARARRMMHCMERAGCLPDVRTFGVVLGSYVSAGDMEEAREVAQEAIRRGLQWDSLVLAELIGMLRASGVGMQAQELLLELLSVHDAPMLGQLIRALCKQGVCAEVVGAGLMDRIIINQNQSA